METANDLLVLAVLAVPIVAILIPARWPAMGTVFVVLGVVLLIRALNLPEPEPTHDVPMMSFGPGIDIAYALAVGGCGLVGAIVGVVVRRPLRSDPPGRTALPRARVRR